MKGSLLRHRVCPGLRPSQSLARFCEQHVLTAFQAIDTSVALKTLLCVTNIDLFPHFRNVNIGLVYIVWAHLFCLVCELIPLGQGRTSTVKS